MISLIELLKLRGFDPSLRTKLVRHEDGKYDVAEMVRNGWIETYQRFQSKPVFHKTEQLVSFVGDGGTRARFVGVYRVRGVRPAREGTIPAGCPHRAWLESKFYYDLKPDRAFDDLAQRVIIDWGKATRAWHQNLVDKSVLEVRASGRVLEPFRDYLEFTLTFDELRSIVNSGDANREWRSRLSAVAGIYLILATTTGAQYVGSAYGAGGIWSRWEQYARNGHGANALLRKLVSSDPAYPRAFTFSILQILPTSTERGEVQKREARYKVKLGSRALGLNAN